MSYCLHGVSIDEDCQGCQSDAEDAAELAAWNALSQAERDEITAGYEAEALRWWDGLTDDERAEYTQLEADHEAYLKEHGE